MRPAARNRLDPYPSRCTETPDVLARNDPVVYGRHDRDAPFAAGQLVRYERDGFLILEPPFETAELALLQAELERLRASVGASDFVIAEPGDSTLRSIFRVHELSPLFRRLVRDARLVRRAEYLLGGPVYVHQTRLNYKPGLRGKEFYWHSDFETWHVEDGMPRMRAVSVSIGLSENTEHNGPLMLIPGSHRDYIACVGETPSHHYRESLRKQEYGVPDPDILAALTRRGGIKSVVGPPGTTVMFDCNAMHGSNGNITPQPRSNVFIVYNSVHNALQSPFGPEKPRPEFLAARLSFEPLEPIAGKLPPGADDGR
ncbi:MAG TPA: ectoine hydroxylase [Gammaproteobacteria bacterium]|jgi:ectoine hydroxylase